MTGSEMCALSIPEMAGSWDSMTGFLGIISLHGSL